MSAKYIKILSAMTSVVMICIIVLNVVIDPFNIYHDKVIHSLNNIKPGALRQIRFIKAEAASVIRPEIVFLGTSRTHEGLRCDHASFAGKRCANLGLHGSSMYELYRYFQHAAAIHRPETVIVGIDFFSFNQNHDTNNHFSDGLLKVSEAGEPQNPGYLAHRIKLAMSIDSLKYSRRTINKSRSVPVKPSGKSETSPDFESWKHQIQGYLDEIWFPKKKPHYTLLPASDTDSMLYYLRLMIREAYNNNVKLYLVISPSHAWLWEALDAAGLWPDFESWKIQLVSISEAEAEKSGRKPYPVWDFSGYNSITTSRSPGMRQGTNKWYSDPSHYKHITGDMLISRVLENGNAAIPKDFGFRLTSGNVHRYMALTRSLKMRYRKQHQDTYEMFRLMARNAKQHRSG